MPTSNASSDHRRRFGPTITSLALLISVGIILLSEPLFAQSPFDVDRGGEARVGGEENREPCPANVCFNEGTCFTQRKANGDKEFECECKDGFGGDLCEQKCALRCQNGGKCRRSSTGDKNGGSGGGEEWCECPAGFGSPFCSEKETPDCRQSSCPPAHFCLADTRTGVHHCEWDLCVRWGSPCSNNATCKPSKNDFLCECPPGFRGRQCADDIDECEAGQQPCQNGATCENTIGSFQCKCTPEFTGEFCTQRVTEHEPRPCPAPFVSTRNESSNAVDCVCPPGKAGHQCELAETQCDGEEQREHCQHGGECVRLGHRAFCICPTGFTGPHCEHNSEEEEEEPNQSECKVKGRDCLNGGHCVRRGIDGNGKPYCKCKGQFTGTYCDRPLRLTAGKTTTTVESPHQKEEEEEEHTTVDELDECVPNPCQNGGVCFPTDKDDGPSCHCPFGRATGKFCQLQCHCPAGQGCKESSVEPGRVQCYRRIEEDNDHSGVNRTNSGEAQEEISQGEINSSEAIAEPSNFDIFARNGTTALGQNISNCSECVNALKCLKGDGRISCLCSPDYTGPLCDMKRSLCASTDCSTKPGQRCLLLRRGPFSSQEDQHRAIAHCACLPGLTGPRCARSSQLGFSNASTLLLQQQQQHVTTRSRHHGIGADYKLALTFRTTLGNNVHLASGETLLGHTEYSLWLLDGQLVLKTRSTNQSRQQHQQQRHMFDSDLRLNDADWYTVNVWSNKAVGTGFELLHSDSGYLLARRTLSGSRLFAPILSTRLGLKPNNDDQKPEETSAAAFVGCMRDVSLNGAEPVEADDERAFDITPGCDREEQCPATTDVKTRCANGGQCIDLWDHFVCECARPFLPPDCARQIREFTFGHGDAPSNILFELNADEQKVIAQKTDISFLVRTNQNRNSPIFFLGESSANASADTIGNTFLALELDKGAPRLNVRLGGTLIYSLKSSVPINDNRVHLVEIKREGNELVLRVDQKAEPTLRLARPFPHPLLADHLIVGTNRSADGAINGRSTPFFKGTIQDFRVNDRFVLFDSQEEGEDDKFVQNLPTIGQKLSDQNLLQGTVSDDVCALQTGEDGHSPCGLHGQCQNTFNAFECKCEHGWMGSRCEQRDFCGSSAGSLCPNGTDCQNADGGFVCTSTATLTPNSVFRYMLNAGNVIKSSAKHTNLSLEFRTRTENANIVKLQSSTDMLVLQLRQGILHISASNNLSAISLHVSKQLQLADGKWHRLVLRQHSQPPANGLGLTVDDNDGEEQRFATNFSLKRFALDGQARISIGLLQDQQGFKGCIRNIRLGTLPPLSFLGTKDAPQMAESLAASTQHFALQRRENVRSIAGQCLSADVCAQNPCLNGGQCEDQFNAMHCQCPIGFEGEFCELPKNECELMNGNAECGPHGVCVDELNGFRCQCRPGFSGPKCSQEETLCHADTCKNGGQCRTVNGSVECECPPKLIGHWCQLEEGAKCSEAPCQNNAQCFQSEHGEIGCQCRPGFSGQLCELRIDPCREMPCANGGKCISSTDNSDTSTSSSSPPAVVADFHCECPREFGGKLCERLTDTCERLGNRSCTGHGRCENVWGGHRCVCFDGWRGRHCSIQVDTCLEEMPCQNGGTCLPDTQNPNGFQCHCPPFHLGERCEIAGICAENPCQNGGECLQTSASEHVCRCPRGYQGQACEERIDLCNAEPCQNGGTCQSLVGDFKCACIPGFAGKKCELDVDECSLPRSDGPACLHGGRCLDRVNSYECNCHGTGYKGPRCESDIDECVEAVLNCQNGDCRNLPGGYRCECKPGYIGQRCHIADPCEPNPVSNRTLHNCVHGRCIRPRVVTGAGGREYGTHECECDDGFTGELCMRLVEAQHAMNLSNFIGLGIVVLLLCLSLGALLYLFVACTRHKRANQGTYSPSSQEMTGHARFTTSGVGTGSGHHQIQHPLPIIHANNHQKQPLQHHRPRRKK